MVTIGAVEAKTNLSELLQRAFRGEEILITQEGSPVARLVPASERETGRSFYRDEVSRLGQGSVEESEIFEIIEEGRS